VRRKSWKGKSGTPAVLAALLPVSFEISTEALPLSADLPKLDYYTNATYQYYVADASTTLRSVPVSFAIT
jgi:hypothetical protein